MLTYDQAIEIASSIAFAFEREAGEAIAIEEESTLEVSFGWVFFYNTKKYLETRNIKYALAGNSPIMIDKFSGNYVEAGTAQPINYYIEEYEKAKSK